MDRPTRNPGLDVLRAAAVLLVLGRHLWQPADVPAWLEPAFALWYRGGWVGVDLFFVLSGFLVSGLLFAEYRRHGTLAPGRFLLRRGFKIYPAFYVFLLVTLLVAKQTRTPRYTPAAVAAEVLFVQNYVPGVWNHTWSLAVEEHFYLLLPLLLGALAVLGKGRPDPFRPLVPTCLGFAAGLLVLRAWNASVHDYGHYSHLFPTHLRIDALLFGVLLAYLHHFRRPLVERFAPRRAWLVLAGVALLAPAFVFELESTPFIHTAGLTLFTLGSGLLLLGSGGDGSITNPAARVLGVIGSHSYSIYLWHMPVLLWGVPWLERGLGLTLPYVVKAALYVVGSVVVGVVMARLVELPLLRLRDRWFPSRARTADGKAHVEAWRVRVGEPAVH